MNRIAPSLSALLIFAAAIFSFPLEAALSAEAVTASYTKAERCSITEEKPEPGRPKVLEFYADWADSCIRLKPMLERLKEQYGSLIDFQSIDVDDPASAPLVEQYEVSPIPALIFVDNSNQVVAYSIGYSSEERIFERELTKIVPAEVTAESQYLYCRTIAALRTMSTSASLRSYLDSLKTSLNTIIRPKR